MSNFPDMRLQGFSIGEFFHGLKLDRVVPVLVAFDGQTKFPVVKLPSSFQVID
jgi:hypothetical protein